jgi:hypothetical protein
MNLYADSHMEYRKGWSSSVLRYCHNPLRCVAGVHKGVGPGPTLAWPSWKQPDISVEVDTDRLETEVGRQEF